MRRLTRPSTSRPGAGFPPRGASEPPETTMGTDTPPPGTHPDHCCEAPRHGGACPHANREPAPAARRGAAPPRRPGTRTARPGVVVAALSGAALVWWLLAAHDAAAWPGAVSRLLVGAGAVLVPATFAVLGHQTRQLARQIGLSSGPGRRLRSPA